MISSIGGFLNLNNLDMTSNANDVIVIRNPNGQLSSTPFNVRFGKVKVLSPSDKVVHVEVNGQQTSAVMKMGADGKAFWLKLTHRSECDHGRPESPIVLALNSTDLETNANTSNKIKNTPTDTGNNDNSTGAEKRVPCNEQQVMFAESATGMNENGTEQDETKAEEAVKIEDSVVVVVEDGSCVAKETIVRELRDGRRWGNSLRKSSVPNQTISQLISDLDVATKQVQEYQVKKRDEEENIHHIEMISSGEEKEDEYTAKLDKMKKLTKELKLALSQLNVNPAAADAAVAAVPIRCGGKHEEGHVSLSAFQLHSAGTTDEEEKIDRERDAVLDTTKHTVKEYLAESIAAIRAAKAVMAVEALALPGNGSISTGASSVASDDAFDSHDDHYLFEDAMGPDAYESDEVASPIEFSDAILTSSHEAISSSPSVPFFAPAIATNTTTDPTTTTTTTTTSGNKDTTDAIAISMPIITPLLPVRGGIVAGGSDAAPGFSGTMDEELITADEAMDTCSNNSGGKSNSDYSNISNDSGMLYLASTLVPTEADLLRLNLIEGHNRVRYITYSSLRGEVAVEANVYLWDSSDRLVVSDVDGTVTKSDVWGHLMPLIGRDWTHPGICSLYSKIEQNGYKFVYLTARSLSQISMTRNFLWKVEQNGFRLPKGPVLTTPQRFFTALTQEVSKKSHLFKTACLKQVLDAFPPQCKPFYAGFGNRISDVWSYAATQIPKHKIFIIEPDSVLEVHKVKHTYNDLARLVDVIFPPIVKRIGRNRPVKAGVSTTNTSDNSPASGDNGGDNSFAAMGGSIGTASPGLPSPDGAESSLNMGVNEEQRSPVHSGSTGGGPPVVESAPERKTSMLSSVSAYYDNVELAVDQEFHSYLYWRLQPGDLISEPKIETDSTSAEKATEKEQKKQPQQKGILNKWLKFNRGSGPADDSSGDKTQESVGKTTVVSSLEGTTPSGGSDSPNTSDLLQILTNIPESSLPASTLTDTTTTTTAVTINGIKPLQDSGLTNSTTVEVTGGKAPEREDVVPSVSAVSTGGPGKTTSVSATGKEGASRGWLFWKSSDSSFNNGALEGTSGVGETIGNEDKMESAAEAPLPPVVASEKEM